MILWLILNRRTPNVIANIKADRRFTFEGVSEGISVPPARFHILIANDHEDGEIHKEENLELIGVQASDTVIAIHGWSNDKFAYRDDGKEFDLVGSLVNKVLTVSGETAEMKYNLSCKF